MSHLPDREVLGLLGGESRILDVAREVSAILRESGIEGAIVGAIAVFLHGHRRTTEDVDVFVSDTKAFAELLRKRGFEFREASREFSRANVPVHLVTEQQIGKHPVATEIISDVLVVSLADLIDMKLRSGTRELLRAQDLADVIALIRARGLRSEFARHLSSDLGADFRKLVQAVEKDASSGGR